jgi:hypothetical protein
MAHRLTRREFGITAGAATLACGLHRKARAADTKTLRFIAQSDLRVLDPVWTTAYITRNHGYMVCCLQSTPSSRRTRRWWVTTAFRPTN